MKVSKILLVGNYGASNFGDDLLLIASKMGLKKEFPEAEILVMAPKKPYDYPLPASGVRSALSFKELRARKGISECDVVVFGGGGLLNAEVPYSVFIWGRVIKLAAKYGKPVFMLGQSFSDLESVKIKELLKLCDFVTVRDNVSARVVDEYEVSVPCRLTSDLVFSLDPDKIPLEKHKFDDEEFVVLNLREYEYLDSDQLVLAADMIIEHFSENTSCSVYLMPFSGEDMGLLERVAEKHRDNGRVFLLPHRSGICLSAISKSKMVISSRLHPNIVGLVLGRPVRCLSYSSKCIGLMKDIGLADAVFDLRAEFNKKHFSDFLTGFGSQIKFDLENIRKKARDNFRLLKTFIEE